MSSTSNKVKLEIQKTYLAIINNSVGTKAFQNFFISVNGKSIDIIKQGQLACAFFVSNVCLTLNLIKQAHCTVQSTVQDLIKKGWVTVKKPHLGNILIWEAITDTHGTHKHIGFYIGNNKAISNSTRKGYPIIHHWTFGIKKGKPIRNIEMIWKYNFKKLFDGK